MADIDFGQLSEALNDKSDRDLRNVDTTAKADAVIDYQVPTAENNYTWYRKYKSGWVEQGGNATLPQQSANTSVSATLDLPIVMQDRHYSVVENRIADGGSSQELTQIGVNRTVTNCSVLYFSMVATSGPSVVNMVISGMAAS